MTRKKLPEYVELAEQIAAQHDGLLPAPSDLNHLCRNLVGKLYRYPKSFAHIPRARFTRRKSMRLAAYVKQAEVLASQNGGGLSLGRDFQAKYCALTLAIRHDPDVFAHIKINRHRYKTMEEHMADAKALAAKNGGLLPSHSVMRKKHSALYSARKRNPGAFPDLKSAYKRTSTADYVVQAKALAEEHGGILPWGSWLHTNGYANLNAAIRRHPQMFSELYQERRSGNPHSASTIHKIGAPHGAA